MFINQIRCVSTAYSALLTNNHHHEDPTPTPEALLLALTLHSADTYPLNPISRVYQQTRNLHEEWLFVLNRLSALLIREWAYGPSFTYEPPSLKPTNLKKEKEFSHSPLQSANSEFYGSLAAQLGLETLIPHNIHQYDIEFATTTPFVSRQKKLFSKQLSIDGESWIDSLHYPHLFLTLKHLVRLMVNNEQCILPYKHLVHARLSFMHNQVLDKPVGTLAEQTLSNYRKYIELICKNENTLQLSHFVSIKLQHSNACLFYYKYREAERSMELCKQILNIEIDYTGKLGRRTKFQQFDTAQLVMDIKEYQGKEDADNNMEKEDLEIIEKEKQQLPKIEEVLQMDTGFTKGPKAKEFEEDSILFEAPRFTEGQIADPTLSLEKQLVVLAHAFNMYETSPKEETLFMKISSIVGPMVSAQPSPPYAIKFSLLVLRSLNEFPRYKNTQRALEQFSELINEYNQEEKSAEDVVFLFSTPLNYQLHLLYLKSVAQKYVKTGLLMSGVEIYEKVGMYEQCVEQLINFSHKDRALKMARQLQQKQGGVGTPRLLCLIGDITNDISQYQKAWETSGEKYPRAQSSLGRSYFNNKQFDKAITAYRKSLKINFYNPADWFTLGCCYMIHKDMEQAIKAFSQTVSIDETQSDAWGNLASCYIYLQKLPEAFTTLQQSTKYCETNWKIWANLLGVSIKIKKFYRYFDCIEKLVELGQKDMITQEVLAKVVQVMRYRLAIFEKERKRVCLAYKNRIERLFESLKKSIGQKAAVWHSYTDYLEVYIEYLEMMKEHYENLHREGKIEQHDLIAEYEEPGEIAEYTRKKVEWARLKQLQSKQKECNMLMVIGWEIDKNACESLIKAVEELIEHHRANKKQDDPQLAIFVKSVAQKISDCLERPVSFKL